MTERELERPTEGEPEGRRERDYVEIPNKHEMPHI